MTSPDKYDSYARFIRSVTRADGVVLIVLNGKHGNGFTARLPEDFETEKLVNLMRFLADQIESEHAAIRNQ